MVNNRSLLLFYTYAPKIIYHTHTHLQKILPYAHHTTLHTNNIKYIKIRTRNTFTHTIKYYTEINCHNLHTYPRYVATQSENLATETLHGMERDSHSRLDKSKHTRKKTKFVETNTCNVSGKIAQNKETCNLQKDIIKLNTARCYSNHPQDERQAHSSGKIHCSCGATQEQQKPSTMHIRENELVPLIGGVSQTRKYQFLADYCT